MSHVIPIDEGCDEDFNDIPPIVGYSTGVFMDTKAPGAQPIPLHVCLKCNGTSFQVGRAAYTTVARCVACRVEKVVHDG